MDDDEIIARALALMQQRLAAPARPSTTMAKVLERWADAHKRLASFACDHARGLFVLKFPPPDGPFAGIPLGDRDPNTLTFEDVDLFKSWRFGTETRRKGKDGNKTPPRPATINREVMNIFQTKKQCRSANDLDESSERAHR